MPTRCLSLEPTRVELIKALPAIVRHISLARFRPPEDTLRLAASPLPTTSAEETLPERPGSDRTTVRVKCIDEPTEGHVDRFEFAGSATQSLGLSVFSVNAPGGRILVSICTKAVGSDPCEPLSVEIDLGIDGLEACVRAALATLREDPTSISSGRRGSPK